MSVIQKLLFAGTIVLLAVSSAMAADVDGKWTLSQAGLNGGAPHVTTFDFKVDGITLTGTVTAPMGGRGSAAATPIAITNGKVNGSAVSFDVVREFAGNAVTTRYEGTVSGNTMHIRQTVKLGNDAQTVAVDAKRTAP